MQLRPPLLCAVLLGLTSVHGFHGSPKPPRALGPYLTLASPATSKTPLRPVVAAALAKAKPLLQSSNSWLFSYADLRPFTPNTLEGFLFVATNLVFFVAGAVFMTVGGSPILGLMVELAGTFSVGYHWSQCRLGGTRRPIVQLAILLDYLFAVPAILGGLAYALSLGAVPVSALLLSALAFSCLALGWFFDSPRAYMLLHGAWHVLGAAAGVELAFAHQQINGA